MVKKRNRLTIILILAIIVLSIIGGYGVYTGFKVKQDVDRLNNELRFIKTQLNQVYLDKAELNLKYNLLFDDVAKLYKKCVTETACKDRYPLISWSCNNMGDEVSNPSHTCICDSSCKLTMTEIKN